MRTFYRNFVMAGVLSLGLAACGDDVTIPVAPPPPPPVETPNITTFTVSPSSATIAPGTFVAASATLITKAGVTGAVTWESSNPAVATLSDQSNNGVTITAVSQGATVITATATAGGQTASASIGITVRPIVPAQISIQSVTTGLTNLPVNISNVFGQIEINMNFDPGEQIVDSVAVFIGNKRAAKQTFATSPSAGPISLSVNTANYVKNTTAGTTTVDYQNGPSTISAAVYPRGSSATATNTIQIVLNNSDGWAADMSAPSANANSAAGLTYWGGPTAGGLTTVTVYPFTYTAGRSVATVTFRAGGCPTFTDMALPFRADFGYATAGATAANCGGAGGYEWVGGARDNVIVTNAIDNTNNAYPLTPTIPNTVVLGSTPDSLRFDWRSPAVSTPGVARTLPAVNGWVNGSFSFINFASTDFGVGLNAARDRATTYTGCSEVGIAMPTGTGADIPECAANTQGGNGAGQIGAPISLPTVVPAGGYVPGSAPYRVTGTETDRLANLGTSGASVTFGVDKTAPSIRWGLDTDAYAAQVVVAVDSVFTLKPVAADEYRVEYLDLNPATNVVSGFYNMGQPDGLVPNRSAQRHALSTAGHANNTGLCVVAAAPPPTIGPAFVTMPTCNMAFITAGGLLRLDGWQGGMSVPNTAFLGEGYWGYASNVTDAAGNVSDTLFRKSVVSTIDPFATGLTVPATLSASAFAFGPTFADSTEVVRQSLQINYPDLTTTLGVIDSLRYSRQAIGVVFDDNITSPFLSSISPNTGAPYVRHLEGVTAAVFPASNIQAVPAGTKPTTVVAWSWNPGGIHANAPTPNPGRSAIIAIPALLVEDGTTFTTFNTGNTQNSIIHWRILASVATTNQFGSTAPLRAQAASPTSTPNPPFARVDFYRLDAGGMWWNYLGSSSSPIGSDQGTYRSWVWAAPGTFVNAWNGATAQTAVVATDDILAVGVTAAGDGLATTVTMTP